MKKVLVILLIFLSFKSFSQEIKKIDTEDGEFLVQINKDGFEYIEFTARQADDLDLFDYLEGLDEFPGHGSVGIHWNLGTRKSHCKSGIGFRCGKKYQISLQYAGTLKKGDSRPKDRSFDVWLTKNEDGSAVLTFLSDVDWDWLQSEESSL